MKPTPRLVFGVVLLSLFVSGLAGLVYEIVWTRYLGLFLGHTSYAVVAVLVAFMGGLALGNAWLGQRADRSQRPLAFYAWLEVGVGAYALAFPTYYSLCEGLYLSLARHGQPGSVTLLVLKFLFSLLTILLPTVLMGGTLPVLTRLVTRSLGELREKVAALYFINSAGAVAGCLVADYWLVPALGLQATVWIGAALNLCVGLLALLVNNWIDYWPGVLNQATPSPPTEPEQFTFEQLRLALIGIGISGFVAMLYEVAWTRLLALALGSSTHAFSLMLMTFITGIAMGAYGVYRWKTLRRSLAVFAWMELVLAATLLGSMFLYEWLPFWFARLAGVLARRAEAYPLYEFTQGLICFAVMFVPAVCLGMTLPLVSRVATAELAQTGRSVGRVFAVNTLGTVLGAAITGFWLLPALGLARTFATGVALNVAIGAMILVWPKVRRRAVLCGVGLAVAVGWVVLAGRLFDNTWQRSLTLGLWRFKDPPPSVAAYRLAQRVCDLKYYCDGAGSTVSVESTVEGGEEQFTLKINGKPDASSRGDASTQLLLGHLPLLLKPDAKQVLVVGLGSGMTCAAVLQHANVRQAAVVELSPEVVEAVRFFSVHNNQVLGNPRLHLVVEDAKAFLQTTETKYDLIISEPSNPWMAGVAAVFSLEFYETCRARLHDDGLMAQWVQIYETNDKALDLVLATFGSVFPRFSVWRTSESDLVLVGSRNPMRVDLAALQRRFSDPAIQRDLARISLTRLPALLACEVLSPLNAVFVPPPVQPVHSDFYPALEYVAQRAFFSQGQAGRWRRLDENLSARPATLLGQYLRKVPLLEEDYQAFARFYDANALPDPRIFRSLAQAWQRDFPNALEPYEFLGRLAERASPAELEASRLQARQNELLQEAATRPEALRGYARLLMQSYRWQRSVLYLPPTENLRAVLERLVATDPANGRVHRLHLAELAWDRGDDEGCLSLGQSAFAPDANAAGQVQFDLDPTAPHRVLVLMIESLWRANRLPEAWELCQQAEQRGYLQKDSPATDPLLEMTCRKVRASAGRQPSQANR
jgi:spermidine synthase